MSMMRRLRVGAGAILATTAMVATIGPAVAVPGAPATPLSVTDGSTLQSDLQAAIEGLVDAGATGAVAIVDSGHYQSRVTAGVARLDPPQKLQVTDQARVASITKTFVSTVALQLVDQGRLRLEDSVEKWLPGTVPNGDAITVRMLLNHTSGLFNYTEDEEFLQQLIATPTRRWTPQELLTVAFAHPPLFAPGTSWSYSNTNYILVGLVLEATTGQPVERLIAQRITRPLHLHSTYLTDSAKFRGRYAHGYLPPSVTDSLPDSLLDRLADWLTDSGYLDVSELSPSSAGTAGALVSSAPDLAVFYRALLGGRLLSPRMLATMMTPALDGVDYGLGLFSLQTPCGTVWGHNGGIEGYVSFALTDTTGRRSGVLLVFTTPDEPIGAALQPAVDTIIFGMFDQSTEASAAAMTGALSGTGKPGIASDSLTFPGSG